MRSAKSCWIACSADCDSCRAWSPPASVRATAASYVISPLALAAVQPDPDRFRDQLSARWLLALGARLVRDVGTLITGATKARKRLATYALDGEVTFASAAELPIIANAIMTARMPSSLSTLHIVSTDAYRASNLLQMR